MPKHSTQHKKLKSDAQFLKSAENVLNRRKRHAKRHPNDKKSLQRAKEPLLAAKKVK
jgi:hypothetical protein